MVCARNSLRSRCRTGLATMLLLGAFGLPATAGTTTADETFSPTGAYLAAGAAYAHRDLGKAAELLAMALANDPTNPRLLRRAFMMALSGGDLPLARQLAERVTQIDPEDQLAGTMLAVEAAKEGRLTPALEQLSALDRDGIARYTVPLIEAWIRAGLDDREGALAALDDLAGMQGFGALAALEQGLILDWMGDLPAARTAYETALDQGMSLRLVQALGSVYERTGDQAAAEALYARFATGNPDSIVLESVLQRLKDGEMATPLVTDIGEGIAGALFQIASALAREGADELSLAYLQLSLDLDPEMAMGWILLGSVLADRGEHHKALAAYGDVPEESPASWPARLSMARALDDLDRVDEAVALLTAMAEERPDRSEPLVELGDLQRGRERFDAAVEAYDRAVERDPTLATRDWSFLYRRGIALERAKQWKRAEADLRQALALNPEHPHLLNYLGYSWIDRGENLAEAQALIEKAVALRPDDGFIIDSLGWAYFRTGQAPKAVEMLERAASLQPEDPVINDHLGDAYWTVGRQDEAVFQWRRALTAAGDDRDLVLAIERKLAHGLAANAGEEAVPQGRAAMRDAE